VGVERRLSPDRPVLPRPFLIGHQAESLSSFISGCPTTASAHDWRAYAGTSSRIALRSLKRHCPPHRDEGVLIAAAEIVPDPLLTSDEHLQIGGGCRLVAFHLDYRVRHAVAHIGQGGGSKGLELFGELLELGVANKTPAPRALKSSVLGEALDSGIIVT